MRNMNQTDITLFGASGDGITDNCEIFNRAFEACGSIYIPDGEYMVADTLKIPSDTKITAGKNARIFRKAHTQIARKDYLLTNADTQNGNCNIEITGGIWDGNCSIEDRGSDLFDTRATTGVLLNFRRVHNIKLSGMTLRNPLCYYTRFCEAQDAEIRDIRFSSDRIIPNQDGIHLSGCCRNFIVDGLYGEKGSPNDDFIALNADDASNRQECFDSINGFIENVRVSNVHSDLCHCFVRLCSVSSTIKNIELVNFSGSCIGHVINLDAARYCRVPLFDDEDYPNGVGHIENVKIKDFSAHSIDPSSPLIRLETNCRNFCVENFRNTGINGGPVVRIGFVDKRDWSIEIDGKKSCGIADRSRTDISGTEIKTFTFGKG